MYTVQRLAPAPASISKRALHILFSVNRAYNKGNGLLLAEVKPIIMIIVSNQLYVSANEPYILFARIDSQIHNRW